MTSRRAFLAAGAGAAAAAALPGGTVAAPRKGSAEHMEAAIRSVLGPGPITPGRVELRIPPLVENGNAVPLTVRVESPMTAADHVRAVHVFTERNPQPFVASFRIGPRAGRAEVSTRIRLVDTQSVVAVCEMSDGSRWSDRTDVVVTLAACLEE
jgi:sulfur-oxidizing protein SoxY